MSLVRTLDEWINDLENLRKHEGGVTLFVGNLYSAGDIRDGGFDGYGDSLEEDMVLERKMAELPDEKVLSFFKADYDRDEDEAYFTAVSAVKSWLYEENYKAKHGKEEKKNA